MGYYTTYDLTWTPLPNKTVSDNLDDLIAEYITNIGEESDMFWCLPPNGEPKESGKWYDHEADMIEMSYAFPDVVFTLHGEGEVSDDIWNKHFLNGEIDVCEAIITYRPCKWLGS